jgi:hypothetical protein
MMKRQLLDLQEKAGMFIASLTELEDMKLNKKEKQEVNKILDTVSINQAITKEGFTS